MPTTRQQLAPATGEGTQAEVAAFLGVTPRTLLRWATSDPPIGPPRYRRGGPGRLVHIAYKWAEVRAYDAAHRQLVPERQP